MSEAASYETILSGRRNQVALITLNRPQALDALLAGVEGDPSIGCSVITGSTGAFAAGADINRGCELAMMCDFILAGDNARFGQPEIRLGTIPGMGGSQRLTRLVGKSRAMEMCLTGRMMDAAEAERCSLASRVVPVDGLFEDAMSAPWRPQACRSRWRRCSGRA